MEVLQMTEKELLKKYYDIASHNLLCYSANYFMDTPKNGFEKDWKEAKAECELLESMIAKSDTQEEFEEEEPDFDTCDDCGAEVNLKRGEDFFVEIPRKGSKMVCEKCYLEKYQQYYK